MAESFAAKVSQEFYFDDNETPKQNLLKQYEQVVVESIITSFCLDRFFVQDQYGGDVDTIHNVREIGKDPEMKYKDPDNALAYEKTMRHNEDPHKADSYINARREISQKQDEGGLIDAYTGQKIGKKQKVDLDHVISADEIKKDRGRILAGESVSDIANDKSNLRPTNRSINRSKRQRSVSEYVKYLEKTKDERDSQIAELRVKQQNVGLTSQERKKLNKLEQLAAVDSDKIREIDEKARKRKEIKIAVKYYKSSRFLKSTAKVAAKTGLQMGARQVVGFACMEIWCSVQEEITKEEKQTDMENLFSAVTRGVRKGLINAKTKYREFFIRFGEGVIAGMLGSLFTTLCNAIFKTKKTLIRMIRESWISIVKAARVLFLNPDGLPLGEQLHSAVKILAIGASVVIGAEVQMLINAWLGGTQATTLQVILGIPNPADILSTFCGALVTGILSCTFVYILDQGQAVRNLVRFLNKMDFTNTTEVYLREQAELFERYAVELMELDWTTFKKKIAAYDFISDQIDIAKDDKALNVILLDAFRTQGIKLPWDGDFDIFMGNRNNHLVFE